MKINFAKAVDYVPDWNGNKELPPDEQVKLKLTPLKVGESLKLMSVLQAAGFDSGTSDKMTPEQTKALVESCADVIPHHITEITGNENFTIDDLVTYMPFMGLAADVLFKLIAISQPSEDDVKNSKPQPA